MERRLIPPEDQRALRSASSAMLAAEIARVRTATDAPAEWRVDPDGQSFYNPIGMTQGEIDAYEASGRAARFTATSRQKDLLATCALIVRARGLPAWNAMTLQQKKDAALAEADVWVTIRQFIEDNM